MFIKLFFLAFFSFSAFAQTSLVATLPELAWAAKQIGGKDFKVTTLLNGSEDPHYVDASPAFVFKVAKAEVVLFNGLELEAGWLNKILQMSGNSKVQPGATGYCDASKKVEKMEAVENYDRSKGDIHPMGNPHYTLSIKRMIQAGAQIQKCLELATGKNYQKVFERYKNRMQKLHEEQKKRFKQVQDKKFMVYHREFSYFFDDFGLESVGSLEEVPGVLPSAAYLSRVAAIAKKENVSLALASSVSPKKYLEKFKELSGSDYLLLEIHPKPEEDFEVFFTNIVDKIIKNAK